MADIKTVKRKVVAFLMDYAKKNRLNGFEVEFSDVNVHNAIEMALDHMNQAYGYKTGYTITSAPAHLLTIGTSAYLMYGGSILKARNQAGFKDGSGTYTDREANQSKYAQYGEIFMRLFDDLMSIHNYSANVQNCFSDMYSDDD